MPDRSLLIGAAWRAAKTHETIDVVDPSTGQVFESLARGDAADIDDAVVAARGAFDGAWGRMTAVERSRVLRRWADLIDAHLDELTALESRDCGKPRPAARVDAVCCHRYFEYYAGAADKLHGETIPFQDGYTVLTLREPHGVTGHIVPWNYPMQIFGRSVGAALAAGNACVVKPAEDACLSILRLAELALEAGLPTGALNIVTGFGAEAGARLSAHPDVDHISFTGSPETGALVQTAAAANNRPVTMELGGKSPQIVFGDVDLEAALPILTNAFIQNAGQTCSAGSRLLVERSAYDRVLGAVCDRVSGMIAGPVDAADDPNCGPLISAKQKARVDSFLERARGDGIAVAATGKLATGADRGGFFQAPMVFGNVPRDHFLAQQEVFGPVLAAMPFEDEVDALEAANGTDFGLCAGIWTADGGRQMRLARGVRSGQVFINSYGAGGGIELPFGGVKKSGFGREKGFDGMVSFTTVKTVTIRHG
ncbi:aldehyde dehydrogenase family protein [Fodinicurvata sp. EGI_FJ10296]|uniref:aldehyde dehydrogenase family protein n=1 Tax=Fodinicurvata sp. EGI_FJ10296 TaxID=3231908 RepID=UPI0034542E58